MAHNLRSPGVSVQVIDQSQFATTAQATVAAAVGFAEKGPIGEPTLILSKEQYIETFGEPISDNYYMGMFADKYLDVSTGWFTRIAKERTNEQICGTVAPGLDMSGITTPTFWVQLENFPVPNNGIYRVTLTSQVYSDLDELVDEVNTQFGSVTLADGSTTLDSYLTAEADETDTFLCITSDNLSNVRITILAEQDASNNIVATSGTGYLGIAADATSEDTNSYAYSWIRVPISPVDGTAASISSGSAITQSQLNQLSAFNLINVKVDGDTSNPFKLYEDVDITPATGQAGTFPAATAPAPATYPLDLTGADNFDITFTGFYDVAAATDVSELNATHTFTVAAGPHANIGALVIALNAALAGATPLATSGNTLDQYIQFADDGNGNLTTVKGTDASLNNYGSQVGITLENGTNGDVTDLGYASSPVNASGDDSTYTAEGVALAINTAIAEIQAAAASDIITLTSSTVGGTSFIEINDATTTDDNAIQLLNFSDGDSDTGTNPSNSAVVNFVAKDAGTFGDSLKVRTFETTNPVTSATEYGLEVFENDDSVEIYNNISWTNSSAANFVRTVLEASDYITVDFGETLQYPNTDSGTIPSAAPPNNADAGQPEYWQLTGGNDGLPSTSTEIDSLAVLALDEYVNIEQYVIDLILAPGFTGTPVVSKLQSIGESRRDLLALVDPPAFLEWTDIIDWHNGNYVGGSVNLNSAYTVATWGWQRDFDPYNEQFIDLPPSIYEAVAIARTESNGELWEAPAGPVRGIVNSISSYTKPTLAQREYLYNDTDPACINPIVQFATRGTQIYGQKTCLRVNRALNRINVVRLVSAIKRNVEAIASEYIFELNNATTWAAVNRNLTSYLSNIQERGGLTTFGVVFDASTNTADRIDQGIMYGQIFIQPVRVAERIFIDLTIQRTGAAATTA